MAEEKKALLDEEDFTRLKTALEKAKQNEIDINQAKSAGIDVGDALERNRVEMERVRKILNTYFPGRS